MSRLWHIKIGPTTSCPSVEGGNFKTAAKVALDQLSGEAVAQLGAVPGGAAVTVEVRGYRVDDRGDPMGKTQVASVDIGAVVRVEYLWPEGVGA